MKNDYSMLFNVSCVNYVKKEKKNKKKEKRNIKRDIVISSPLTAQKQ